MLKQLSIERTTVIIGFILLLAIAVRAPADTDTWWHLRSADTILQNGTINGDPFSHTNTGGEWINHSWGSQLVMLAAWRLGGNVGLALFTAILAIGGLALLYPISSGNGYLRIFTLILGAAAAAVFWSARPQMVSFFYSCVVLWIVYRAKLGETERFWLLIPLMWLWGNMHAGYSIGYIFLGAFLVGEFFNLSFGITENTLSWAAWRKLLLFTLLSIPVIALSPYGYKMLLVPFNTVSIGELRQYIQEWNSPNFQGRETYPFIAMLIAFLGLAWGSRLRFDWSSFFLMGGTLFLALLYGRNIAVFAVVAIPVLTHHADNLFTNLGLVLRTRRFSKNLARINLVLILLVGLGVGVYCAGVLAPSTIEQVQAERLPVAAADYLNQHDLPREMFNSYNWGGYLMFAAPQYRVFIDGRTDLYGAFLQTYLDAAIAADNWREILTEYNIHFVVIEKGSGLDLALRDEPNWSLVYEDELAVIHVEGQASEND